MIAQRGSLRRVIIAVSVLAVLAAAVGGVALVSWKNDRRAVLEFACDGTVVAFTSTDDYSRPVLMVRNEDGSAATLESWALALTERDASAGDRIIKQRNEPDGLIDGKPVTFLRDR